MMGELSKEYTISFPSRQHVYNMKDSSRILLLRQHGKEHCWKNSLEAGQLQWLLLSSSQMTVPVAS